MTTQQLYWHVHHNLLAEFLTEPVETRIAYIKTAKPENEIAIRLRWLTPVQNAPPALVQAWKAYDKAWKTNGKAWKTNDKARGTYYKAWATYDKAWAECSAQLEKLHTEQHPSCPWNGKTLFPKEE